MSNVIQFPKRPKQRQHDPASPPSVYETSVTLIPTDAAYYYALTDFKAAAAELQTTPNKQVQKAIAKLAANTALLVTHPSCPEGFITSRICYTLDSSSDLVKQSVGDYPEIVKVLGLAINSRNKHPTVIKLRTIALRILSQNPGEFDLKTGERLGIFIVISCFFSKFVL